MAAKHELDEDERIAAWFGLMVGKRAEQWRRRAPGAPAAQIAALAAADIWLATTDSENPVRAAQEFLELEDSL